MPPPSLGRALDDKAELNEDEEDTLIAALTEFQVRLLLEMELEVADLVYWDALFWQDAFRRSVARRHATTILGKGKSCLGCAVGPDGGVASPFAQALQDVAGAGAVLVV
jgi:hypothetical protein